MLNHLVRNLGVLLRAMRQPPVRSLLEETSLPLRVRFADLDYNGHMNNARYLDVLELGRVDALVRSGLAKMAWQRKLMPIVGSMQIRYIAELKPRERFEVRTRVTGWDERWMWAEQELVRARDSKVCARAVFRAQMRSRQGAVPPGELFRACGLTDAPLHRMPHHLAAYALAEADLHRTLAPPADGSHRPHRPHHTSSHARS